MTVASHSDKLGGFFCEALISKATQLLSAIKGAAAMQFSAVAAKHKACEVCFPVCTVLLLHSGGLTETKAATETNGNFVLFSPRPAGTCRVAKHCAA